MIRVNALAAVACGCLLSVTPAAAQTRTPVTVHISTAGLDPATSSGMARLKTRLRSAVTNACAPDSSDLRILADSRECRSSMLRDGEALLAALAQDGTRLAAARAGGLDLALAR
jgi:UrcA family protein